MCTHRPVERGGGGRRENPQGSWGPKPWNLGFVTIHRILIKFLFFYPEFIEYKKPLHLW
jgi:hypothetical protein